MQKQKVEGVVVLYQPDVLVIDNIKSYVNGLERLYVIDNSATSNKTVVNQLNAIQQCHYIKNPDNEGIASALNKGAKLAMANQAQWLLTMDQDSKFEQGDIHKLISFTLAQNEKLTGLVSPFHKTGVSVKPEADVDEVLTIMTSGNLINLYAYQTIGGFDERYFIDAVDWDYCLRLNLHQFKVLRFNTVTLTHNLGNASQHTSVTGKQITALNYNKTRRYYITRNKLIILFKYWHRFPGFCMGIFKSLFRDVRHILLYENGKLPKFGAFLKGVFHFITGKRGR